MVNTATNTASQETRRAFARIVFIFFVMSLFHSIQLLSVCASIVIYIIVTDITFGYIKSCISMGMLHVVLAATVKQPVLTNSLSA